MNLEEEVIYLRAENAELRRLLADLTEKFNFLLQSRGHKFVKKDSHNSSLPPSSDLFSSKTKSLRPPSDLKSGGQTGHSGTTLEMRSEPDTIVELKSTFCSQCGAPLNASEFVIKAKRQVIDIPPIIPVYTEYRQLACHCLMCDHEQIADFPKGVTAPIQYGSSVESVLSYLSVYQYIPYARLQNLLTHVFALPLSQGTIGNILERTAVKCQGVYEIIKTHIAASAVVGSDETSAKVNGKNWWMWVWQTYLNTYIVASDNRGYQTIAQVWNKGLKNCILVSDRWAAQLKSSTKGFQICLAHLLRNIIFLEESEKHPFATQFKERIIQIFDLRKELIKQKKPFETESQNAQTLEKNINALLIMSVDKQVYPNTHVFQKSMLKYRDYLLPCIYNLDIPPDNNSSEKAIRNIKVKQKVSGQFKTGQHAFCVIRSVMDTLNKRKLDILPTLNQIVNLQPV